MTHKLKNNLNNGLDFWGKYRLQQGITVTRVYYSELLTKLRQRIVEKRRGKLAKGVPCPKFVDWIAKID